MLRRPTRRTALIALAVVAFLGISTLVARYLTTDNAERNAIYQLLRAEARGDAAAMTGAIAGCGDRPSCRTTAADLARRLKRPGPVKILNLDSKTSHALTDATGLTRVAWKAPGRFPVVQCVTVRRRGNPVTGTSITLLRLSAPIARTGLCR
jgi:hypothetical protein